MVLINKCCFLLLTLCGGWLGAIVFDQHTDVFSIEGSWMLAVTVLQSAPSSNSIRHGNKQTVLGFRTRSCHAMWHP